MAKRKSLKAEIALVIKTLTEVDWDDSRFYSDDGQKEIDRMINDCAANIVKVIQRRQRAAKKGNKS